MSTISTQLRNFKEPSKEQLLHLFFSIPEPPDISSSKDDDKQGTPEAEKMDINAVLSLGEQGVEDAYVSLLALTTSEQLNVEHHSYRQGSCISSHHISRSPH